MFKLKIPQRSMLWTHNSKPNSNNKGSRALLIVFIGVGLISALLLAYPYLPKLRFILFKPKIDASTYAEAAKSKSGDSTQIRETGNRLVMPDIGVNAQIIEGSGINTISKNQGVWRETKAVDPSTSGNMVIAGHRWLYTSTNGGYFYNLPELKNKNIIYIRWDNKVYEYEVYNHKTVLPTQVDIRDSDPIVPHKLTMYTCYPLGSTAKRYVIEAKLIE